MSKPKILIIEDDEAIRSQMNVDHNVILAEF
jgi:hypothetical protein